MNDSILVNEKVAGSGGLELQGNVTLDCTFEITQYFDGILCVECIMADSVGSLRLWASQGRTVGRLVGTTSDGRPVRSEGPLQVSELNGSDCSLRAIRVIVGDQGPAPAEHLFTLTNVDFPSGVVPVRLVIPTLPQPTDVVIEPSINYENLARLQRHHKLTAPTAILTVATAGSIGETAEVADHLCRALSIVQGHKITWITHASATQAHDIFYLHLANRVTKSPSGLAINFFEGNNRRLPLSAAQDCYTRACQLEEQYSWNRVLEIWLEARSDHAYTETRALKFVTAIEALRAIVLSRQPPRFHLAAPEWEAFLTYIIPIARFFLTAGLKQNKQQVDTITTRLRWESLNRTSFRSEINATLRLLGVKEQSRHIELFVDSRNKLIHEGMFRCQSIPAIVAAEPDAPQNVTAEYFFIAGFVDRVITKAAGLTSYLGTAEKPEMSGS